MFDNEFEVVVADTADSRLINYQLRYQVYCLDTRFEDAAKFENELEMDEYDHKAEAHFLVRSRHTGEWVAAMRMLKDESGKLPTMEHSIIEKDIYPNLNHKMIEISRLCIVSDYRKKTISNAPRFVGNNALAFQSEEATIQKNREPEIMLGLLRAAYRYSLNNNIHSWLFMITPGLARLLDKIGLNIEKVGPTSNFRGKRVPHVCDMQTFTTGLSSKSLKVATMFDRHKAYSEFSKLQENLNQESQKRYA